MSRLWDLCVRLGLARPLRTAYFVSRAWPRGWRRTRRVGGVEATFATTSIYELQRTASLHGEESILARLLADLDGDEVVWDVGATIGTYACFAAGALSEGVVVAVEPEPTNHERLVENLRRNAPSERWRTANVALAAEDGTGWLAENHAVAKPPAVGAGHFYLSPDGAGIEVPRRSGETLVADGYPRPDVLKVDVQGAELDVLRGMGDVLDGVDVVYAELHREKCERYGTTAESVERFLRDAGFDLARIGEPDWSRGGVYFVRASR